ncbi:MAG: ArnT family glycosyltransferase [Chthoniobacterales bacterium]
MIRLPALVHPQALEDEDVYSLVANEIVDGGRPYIDAVERKPPLLFWTYAAVFRVAGKYNWKVLHAVALLWTLGTMAGAYVIGRQLFDRETGLVAAALYSVFQPWGAANNLSFDGEVLMNLPLVWAWAIAFGPGSSRLRPELLAAGALLCAGFLLKQPAAIAAVPLGLYLLFPSYRASRGVTRTDSITHATMLSAGFFSTLGLVALVLSEQGILQEAFYWTFTNNSIPHVFLRSGIFYALIFSGACLPAVLGAALAFRDRNDLWKDKVAERSALLGLLVASALGTAAGARFSPHYFIQLVPPLVLLAAPHYARLWRDGVLAGSWFLRPRLVCAWLALTVSVFAILHWKYMLRHREPTETERYLTEHSSPNDRIFVWAQSSAEVYARARRRPACRYVLPFPLTGFIFGGALPGVDTRNRIVPGAWDNLAEDFRHHPPVLIADFYSNPDAQYPVKDFPMLAALLAEHYQPVEKTEQGVIYRMR